MCSSIKSIILMKFKIHIMKPKFFKTNPWIVFFVFFVANCITRILLVGTIFKEGSGG